MITGLIVGLDKRSRVAQGLRGGILGAIYLAAFILVKGETTFVAAGGSDCAFASPDNVSSRSRLSSLSLACLLAFSSSFSPNSQMLIPFLLDGRERPLGHKRREKFYVYNDLPDEVAKTPHSQPQRPIFSGNLVDFFSHMMEAQDLRRPPRVYSHSSRQCPTHQVPG